MQTSPEMHVEQVLATTPFPWLHNWDRHSYGNQSCKAYCIKANVCDTSMAQYGTDCCTWIKDSILSNSMFKLERSSLTYMCMFIYIRIYGGNCWICWYSDDDHDDDGDDEMEKIWTNDKMTIWCRNMWSAKCLRFLVHDIDHNVLCHIFRLSPVRIDFEDVGVSIHLEDEQLWAKGQSSGFNLWHHWWTKMSAQPKMYETPKKLWRLTRICQPVDWCRILSKSMWQCTSPCFFWKDLGFVVWYLILGLFRIVSCFILIALISSHPKCLWFQGITSLPTVPKQLCAGTINNIWRAQSAPNAICSNNPPGW